MKNTFLSLISLSFFLLSCHKEENNFGLPPATQNGANTFGCLLDGKPWVAEIGPGIIDPLIRKIRSNYDELNFGIADNSYFSLSATFISLPDSVYDIFSFNIRPVYKNGNLDFSKLLRKDIECSFSQPVHATHTSLYVVDTLYPINFNIQKLDTIANICAGTCNFRLIDKTNKDTLEVTEGRFDIIYQPD